MKLVRPFVNQETLLLIYNALIQPLFDYCDIVWDSLSVGLATRLQKLQNRAGRIILRANYETRSEEVLKILEWENLSARRMKHKAIAMYKVLNENAPKYLKDDINKVEDSNPYNLRNNTHLRLPFPNTEYMNRSFKYSGPKLWNSLSSELKTTKCLSAFKKKLNNNNIVLK